MAWLEKDADLVLIKRIVDVSDITILEQLSLFLSAVAGFEYPDDFRQLTSWLSRFANDRVFASDITRILLLWVRETNWKNKRRNKWKIISFPACSVKRSPITDRVDCR